MSILKELPHGIHEAVLLGGTMELVFQDINKSYGSKRALKGINLVLSEGVYGLLGPNGAGKSTMMNILVGNLPQSSGKILLDGIDVRTLGDSFREKIGYMPQQQTFYPDFSVEQFLFYMASIRGLNKEEANRQINWALEEVSLSDIRRKKIKTLSGGMKQRLLLAQAIIHDPKILILDEPTAGLDPKQRIAVRNLIGKISLHKIVILSTHVVQDVEFIANDLILMSDGVVRCMKSPGELLHEMDGMVWETILSTGDSYRIDTLGTVSGVSKVEDGVLVRYLSDEQLGTNCVSVKPRLEDVYLHYFGQEEPL